MDVTLVIFKEDGQRREFPLYKESSLVGRSPDCDLQIPLGTVSRRHCEIVRENDSVVLRDVGSSNGTFHNNQRIAEPQTLMAGDHVRIGPVTFTVVIDGEPAQIKPVRTILGDLAMEPVNTPDDHPEKSGTVDVAPPEQELIIADEGGEEEHSQAGDDPLAALAALNKPDAKK
ncbi:MAG: FHA domain-containing protein [Phycisphaerae bacterium]